MNAFRLIGLLGATLALAAVSHLGCGADDGLRRPGEAVMVEHTAGDSCLGGTATETAAGDLLEEDGPEVLVKVDGLRIFVVHKNAIFNCCLDSIEVGFSQEEWLLTLKETEVVTKACRCLCAFEVTAAIEVSAPGVYVLEIWTGPELVWRDEVEI